MKTIAIVVADPARAGEALRAAVGLTLRGDRVVVVPLVDLAGHEKALGTLKALGHRVDGTLAEVETFDVVERWSPPDQWRPADEALLGAVFGVELDLAGEICPFTFVRTKLALEEMAPGERLRVVVDHEPATHNVPRSVREWGQNVLRVGPLGPGRWEIWIEKKT